MKDNVMSLKHSLPLQPLNWGHSGLQFLASPLSGWNSDQQGGALDQPRMAEENDTSHCKNGNENGKSNNVNEVEDNESEITNIDQESELEGENTYSSVEMKHKKKKALLEFRCRVENAILGNYLLGKPPKNLSPFKIQRAREQLRDITLWGVPLLPSKGHEGTDIVLLKFLKAKDFKVHEAFGMLWKTLKWRRDYKTEGILDEKLDSDLENLVCFVSRDKEGHPLCFLNYGPFKDKEFYKKVFGSEEKCDKFLRWKVQNMEKVIKKLRFKSGGVNSIVQIIDLKNSPGPAMKELHSVSKKFMLLLQDYYPELIHKIIVINIPLWYYASHVLLLRVINQRTKRKFVFARPSKATKTLLKIIAPENLPVEYGGLKRENDDDFTSADNASEHTIRANSAAQIEFPVTEAGVTMVWDLTVVGWDVSYKEEFIPDDEGSYKILLQNQKIMGECVRNSFYISEPGRIVLTIDNGTLKKKRVLYRSKGKPTVPMYIFLKK